MGPGSLIAKKPVMAFRVKKGPLFYFYFFWGGGGVGGHAIKKLEPKASIAVQAM